MKKWMFTIPAFLWVLIVTVKMDIPIWVCLLASSGIMDIVATGYNVARRMNDDQ